MLLYCYLHVHVMCTQFSRIRQKWNRYHRPHYRPPLPPPTPPLIAHVIIRIWDEYGQWIRWVVQPTSRLPPQNGYGASSYESMQEIASSVAPIPLPPRLWRSSMPVWVLMRRYSAAAVLVWCLLTVLSTSCSRERKCHRRSGLRLFFSYCITDSDVLATIRTRYIGH